MREGTRTVATAVLAVCLLTVGVVGFAAPDAAFGSPSVAPEPSNGTDEPTDRLEHVPPDARADLSGVARAHLAGVTGAGVRVGIVDVTGFDLDQSALAENVAGARAFGPDATIGNAGADGHGTASAALVSRVAPGADLYLASVNSASGYRRALAWFSRLDVDVVVAPEAFYGKFDTGRSAVSRATTALVRSGVVVVAPTGNLADGHWQGVYRPANDTRLAFGDDALNPIRGGAGRVSVWLSWERSRAYENYTVSLYRATRRGSTLVARSHPYRRDAVPNEHLSATIGDGRYYVVVRGPQNATGTALELESTTHTFVTAEAAGSVAPPAAARGVVGVGALNPQTGRVESFSSRGPTADGRLGVDLVAPDRQRVAGVPGEFVGTSASAAYVGGVAALVLDANRSLSPRAVEQVLERTATDVGRPGIDVAAGHGRVRPWRAVRFARNRTTQSDV